MRLLERGQDLVKAPPLCVCVCLSLRLYRKRESEGRRGDQNNREHGNNDNDVVEEEEEGGVGVDGVAEGVAVRGVRDAVPADHGQPPAQPHALASPQRRHLRRHRIHQRHRPRDRPPAGGVRRARRHGRPEPQGRSGPHPPVAVRLVCRRVHGPPAQRRGLTLNSRLLYAHCSKN